MSTMTIIGSILDGYESSVVRLQVVFYLILLSFVLIIL